ncbi:hypothetical protein MCI89_24430 [Muricomes sp. OA1]|jgi:hypothetical protein|uniref:hypothetical protein n=1 Tax=Lachnospiraceae TaxID=186803 RepID=UPI00046F5A08|nr:MULTISPECIES: hypothetical protein [Lachnospiraceae]MCH1975493.1 hypothetical protein [Muricomes sp. OA1]MRM88500.1 hypothetical protein [Faecalicatena contorta]
MIYAAMLSLGITIVLFLLSIIFKLAGKLRLPLPVIYFLLISTVLNKWAASHEKLAFIILFGLLSITLISWIVSLYHAIQERRYMSARADDIKWQLQRSIEMGIPRDAVYIDARGDMRYEDTDESVF